MLNKIVKWMGYVVGGVVGLALLAYLGLLIINWKDRPPSESARLLVRIYETREPVADEENAYAYIMGFNSPREVDPLELGVERIQWLREAPERPVPSFYDDPLDQYESLSISIYGNVQGLADTCKNFGKECAAKYESEITALGEWVENERWLLDRYRNLTALKRFRDTAPYALNVPPPSYSVVFQGQEIAFADAWLAAVAGKSEYVQGLLEDDIGFWRNVLRNSDTVLSKMIATAAIERNLGIGNLIFRRLQMRSKDVELPPSWLVPISVEERSMARPFVGEWMFADSIVEDTIESGYSPLMDDVYEYEDLKYHNVLWGVLSPLYQPQESRNNRADLFVQAIDQFTVNYEGIPDARIVTNRLGDGAHQPFKRAYNLAGDWIFSYWWSNLGDYGARVSDLEGRRRAAVLMTELRNAQADESTVEAELIASEYNDPYSGEAFEWKPCSGEVVFRSLMPNVSVKPYFLL